LFKNPPDETRVSVVIRRNLIFGVPSLGLCGDRHRVCCSPGAHPVSQEQSKLLGCWKADSGQERASALDGRHADLLHSRGQRPKA
jgi:hypothetical protein